MKNLVFIIADQLSRSILLPFCNKDYGFEALKRLAAHGITATKYHTPSAVCTPSRGCILTGLTPFRHGAYRNGKNIGMNVKGCASVLKDNGYDVSYIGKWHLGKNRQMGDSLKNDNLLGFSFIGPEIEMGHAKSVSKDGETLFATIQEKEEYTVRCEAQELGTVVMPPPVGEKLAIAGHVWTVLDIDHKRHQVYCELVKGSVPAYFGECPGDLHTRILARMRQVLLEERNYPYLMKNAVARLEQARFTTRHSGAGKDRLISLGGKMWCLLPWMGTYPFLTLERVLKIKCAQRLGLKKLDSARPYYMQFTMQADAETFFRVLREELEKPIDPLELVYPKELPLFDKYDEYLPEELVKKGFALGVLDLEGLRELVRNW